MIRRTSPYPLGYPLRSAGRAFLMLTLVCTLVGGALLLFTRVTTATPDQARNLKVMRQGLGIGTVSSTAPGINCGADCGETYMSSVPVELTANAGAASAFTAWHGDCEGVVGNVCTVTMSAAKSVRAEFGLLAPIPTLSDFTPLGISTFLSTTVAVDSPERFLAALPDDFKQNWILMTRSESLQTGTAQMPRILLPNATAQFVFTIGMTPHSSYPGSHPNAIEYMQWDPEQKNFRFHEIVVAPIPAMGSVPARGRGVSADDAKCGKCHSTRNILNRSDDPGTSGVTPGTVLVKNKPNWDTYDSWGGMMPFNRDRIYQGTVEAAAFRTLFNPWTWSANDPVRMILEQLTLQPSHVAPSDSDYITRLSGGPNDGHVVFAFDPDPPAAPVLEEGAPVGSAAPINTSYAFNGTLLPPETQVIRGGDFVTLHHSVPSGSDEGRGVQLFDLLGGLDGNLDLDGDGQADGNFNAQRIADELINHFYATGSVGIEVRPIALAILKGSLDFPPARCLDIDTTGAGTVVSTVAGTPLTADLAFFNARHGILGVNTLFDDTAAREQSIPIRKADMQKINLDRSVDPYLLAAGPDPANGLIVQYGANTFQGATDLSPERIRQEVFRRPLESFSGDSTIMDGIYIDREDYIVNSSRNTELVTLFRYFLEPLGVSVDKWSMGVRGRSRTYTFADVFDQYIRVLERELQESLTERPVGSLAAPFSCASLITAVNETLSNDDLPADGDVPKFTDIQRIFNKGCIECHGGLDYPPYSNFGSGFNLAEDESPPAGDQRLDRSYAMAASYTTNDLATSTLYQRVIASNTNCAATPALLGPTAQMMPCGGPMLSQADIKTIERWILGGRPYTVGDPHIETVDGVNYDFQSAGEFTLLRDEGLEIQTRQSPVSTEIPIGPDDHTGLTTCAALNTAVALRVGPHRITYQPNLSGKPDPQGMQLRVDGKLTDVGAGGLLLPGGGRILRTTAEGGIQVEAPGGAIVRITPRFWDYYEVWFLDVSGEFLRGTEGIMGAIAPGNWLPALPDGTELGARPADILARYDALYEKFADSWRVSDASTLFDYAPGTSTATFTMDAWPGATPQQCHLPGVKLPQKPMGVELAQQYCANVADPQRKEHCIQDVRVTGDPVFAEAYLAAQGVIGNARPATPPLTGPANNLRILTEGLGPILVNFAWNAVVDDDDSLVLYRFCLWKVNELFNLNRCQVVAQSSTATLLENPTQTPSVDVELEQNQSYFWKIIAEDGKGGTTESETRRIMTAAPEEPEVPEQQKMLLPLVGKEE